LKKINSLPALASSKSLRYFNFIALYFAQGIPEGMLLFGIPAWMAMNGKSPGEIAGFAIAVGLPWSFKVIVAPLMDRYTYLPMGRKRPWVIFGQLGLVASCIAMAFVPDPLHNLNMFMAAGFTISCFGAFQDVATDGMAVDIIPTDQQARANGFMWGAKIIGVSSSLALGSWLLNEYNFTVAMFTLAVMIGTLMIVPLLLREQEEEKMLPWTEGTASPLAQKMQLDNWSTIFKSVYKVFSLRNSLLLGVLLFLLQGSYNYIGTLLPIFTVKELGWTNVEYSQIYSVAKLTGGIVGMLIGGILIERFGKKRMLTIYVMLMVLTTAVLAFNKALWISSTFIMSYMIVFNILNVFASIGIFSIAMQCCWRKISASQFTLFMTLGNLGRLALAALIGPITSNFSWEISLFAFGIMVSTVGLLLQFLNIGAHEKQLHELEEKDTESQVIVLAAN
jgi:PAT family beta-lactamase induction signal transducer AmpG